MRLFVAVWPPADAVEELSEAVEAVRPLSPGLRWTRQGQWHLTMAFLGEVPVEILGDLTRRLPRAAARHQPMRLWFGAGGRFGDRVLYVRMNGDIAALRQLAASVDAAARRSGVPIQERPYRPHLTLARSASGTDLRPLVAALEPFRGSEWTAQQLALMVSRPPSGPRLPPQYETLDAWQLGGERR